MNTGVLVRGLVAGVLATVWVLTGAVAPTTAAPDRPDGLASHYADATAVVVGRITQVQRDDGRTVFRVGVEQSYKGDLDGQIALTGPVPGATCAVQGAETGQRLVFFVRENQGRGEVDSCTGTQPTAARVEKRLLRLAKKAGEGPGQQKPEAATLKRVSYEEPWGFWRMAAPGGAAVILGILGMLVAVRLARR